VDGASHVSLQDLEIRGGGYDTVVLDQSHDLAFEKRDDLLQHYGVRATGTLRPEAGALRPGGQPSALVVSLRYQPAQLSTSGRSGTITRFGTHALLREEAGRRVLGVCLSINALGDRALRFTGSPRRDLPRRHQPAISSQPALGHAG